MSYSFKKQEQNRLELDPGIGICPVDMPNKSNRSNYLLSLNNFKSIWFFKMYIFF